MYCPKCGQQQVAEEALFCSRCGLKLNVVRACVAGEPARTFSTTTAPPHREINSGVCLMLLGVLFTSGIVAISNISVPGAFLVLTLAFISILLASRHLIRTIHKLLSRENPPRETAAGRRGLGFGALLMYIGTLLSACAATLVPGRFGGQVFFITLVNVFVLLLLFSRRIMIGAHDLLAEESGFELLRDSSASTPLLGSAAEETTLPFAQTMPIGTVGARYQSTAEIVEPPSITERTTNLLGANYGRESQAVGLPNVG